MTSWDFIVFTIGWNLLFLPLADQARNVPDKVIELILQIP